MAGRPRCWRFLPAHLCLQFTLHPHSSSQPDVHRKCDSGRVAGSTPADSRAIGARFYIYNATPGAALSSALPRTVRWTAYPLQGQVGDHIQINWERSITDGSSTICRPLGPGSCSRDASARVRTLGPGVSLARSAHRTRPPGERVSLMGDSGVSRGGFAGMSSTVEIEARRWACV
jgi:hypothetical protein